MRRLVLVVAVVVAVLGMGSPAIAQTQYDAEIEAACARHGCDAGQLKRVAMCESWGMHVDQYGNFITGPNGEIGLFQFHPQGTWGAVTDVYTQIDIAAREFADGYAPDWVCQGW